MADDPTQSPPEPDIVHTSQTEVKCDGDGGALGHPRVFLHMENGQVECPYCDRVFILTAEAD
ncbi:MAG: zinc-finger domain-containing protein [Alphaproteobacteria bacterium]|nr:MAG: zinc-finger domain-containing protein [Alphaproteobacteria bacterium]